MNVKHEIALGALLLASLLTGCSGGGDSDEAFPPTVPGMDDPGGVTATDFNAVLVDMVTGTDDVEREPEEINDRNWVIDDAPDAFDDVFDG